MRMGGGSPSPIARVQAPYEQSKSAAARQEACPLADTRRHPLSMKPSSDTSVAGSKSALRPLASWTAPPLPGEGVSLGPFLMFLRRLLNRTASPCESTAERFFLSSARGRPLRHKAPA